MRKLIFELITAQGFLTDKIPADRWLQSSAVDTEPARPFAVIGMDENVRGATRKPGVRRLRIHIHDDPGSYVRIDKIIEDLIDVLDNAKEIQGDDDSYLAQADWNETSPDLFDDGHRTITKNASFTLVGRG